MAQAQSDAPTRPRVMLVSDLDHTMVQNEDSTHARLLAFDHVWTAHCKAAGNLLVFSTGRSPTLFAKLWEEAPLLTPDVLICSVGSEIFYNTASPIAAVLAGTPSSAGGTTSYASFVPDPQWMTVLDEGWSRSEIESLVVTVCPNLVRQAGSEQRPHKLSYTFPSKPSSVEEQEEAEDVIDALRTALLEGDLSAKVIYSGGQDVDVLSAGAGKGCGLAFLKKRLGEAGWPLDLVQVNGDSGNDSELLDVEGVVGCVVANAHPELRKYAQELEAQGATHVWQAKNPCAGGIVETMGKFGLVPSGSPILAYYAPLLGTSAAPPPPHGNEPPLDELRGAGLSLEEGAREWGWRLGRAIAQHLAERHGPELAAHSPLRLFVTSGCTLRVEHAADGADGAGPAAAPISADATGSVSVTEPGAPDAAELAADLEATSAAAAAEDDPAGLVRRAWIDQLDAKVVDAAAAAATGGPLATVRLVFKVCSFQPSGLRSSAVWSVTVEGEQPADPVPEGFLASAITITGPLPAAHRKLGLPTAA